MLVVNESLCLECGGCVPLCPEDALFLSFNCLECNTDLCTLCRICIQFCPVGAIEEGEYVDV
ncbi:MAG: ferredoxin [Candidatus Zixiibacteriota bacterium]|nr:MAG: ferredoxin [candidate division Zixibacteria bacterium]HDL03371.1 ferredoxin [candidate division Zixibacteria bacterium]